MSTQIISKYSVISLSDKYARVKIWGTTLNVTYTKVKYESAAIFMKVEKLFIILRFWKMF